jgi:hypothetical protein
VILAVTGATFAATYAIAILRFGILVSQEVLMIERQLERFGMHRSGRLLSMFPKRLSEL